jgi:steroid delta-isomerase-like uncharacterized protein
MVVAQDEQNIAIARRWFDAVNSGDLRVIDEILADDVVDHSTLNFGHGDGASGHKSLVDQLRSTFPEWESRIEDITSSGDLVTIRHRGRGYYPGDMRELMGPQAQDTPDIRKVDFEIVSTVRIKNGQIVEHWAEQGPLGRKDKPAGKLGDAERRDIARRWFDAVNEGDLKVLDEIMADDVIDHSDLNLGHGDGASGHKSLVDKLRTTFPEWSSKIDDIVVNGDLVTIYHSGSGYYPGDMRSLMGPQAQDTPEIRKIEFAIVSTIRINDDGLITEHWANEGPFGKKAQPGEVPTTTPYRPPTPGPGPYPGPPTPGPGPEAPAVEKPSVYQGSGVEGNKLFLRNYVGNVIDGENPPLAGHYFSQNFYNHDRAPGEEPGLQGVTDFLESIFAAFSGFQTQLPEQLGEDDMVVGRWTQTFKNTGSYLGFPATGKAVNVAGITIVRVRDGRIVEEWEARDVIALLRSLGVPLPLRPLEGGTGTGGGTTPTPGGSESKELARRFFYEVWSDGNVGLIDQLFASDYVDHNPLDGQNPGRDGIRQFVQATRNAFPDLSVSVDLQVAEGSRVANRYTFRGTHRGTFMGLPASNKAVEITGITVFSISGGQIRERFGYFELATLLAQVGQAPWAGGAPPSGGGVGPPGGGGGGQWGGGSPPPGGGTSPGTQPTW